MSELINAEPAAASAGMVEVQQSRAVQEVQAAMIVAQQRPRNVNACVNEILDACKRPKLAESAVYAYPRGGQRITGPSIRLAEVMAQCWGNVDFGIVEVEQRRGESVVMAYCHDLQKNTRQQKTFTVKHERHTKKGVTSLTDPRDVYELAANNGARRLRACILGVIPGYVVDEAMDQVNKTLAGNSDEPLVDRVRKVIDAFKPLGVLEEHIEQRLGHKLDAIIESQLVELRQIYAAIKDGMSKREDWFDIVPDKPKSKASDKLK